jgi:UDP-2,3-diacylglucosamine pyrophosphatase LpxH
VHDIVVVSDLHLGRGKNPETGRYYRLEAFFYDDDFDSFCAWLVREAADRKTGIKLVLNGDTFDLLRIEPDEEPDTDATLRERRYGHVLTPAVATKLMNEVLAGHPAFVRGIARVLAAGHRVVILPGNHDLEVQWEPVQAEIREAVGASLTGLDSEADAGRAQELLTFEPWFHHEPGRIWIEHGNQYDSDNSFRYPLRSKLVGSEDDVFKAEKDVPMGTFFQRYLYNGFGNITFIVPSGRANLRYFRWLLINKPRILARVATSHFPFFIQVLRRIAKATGGTEEIERANDEELDELVAERELGEKLREVAALKRTKGSAAAVTRGIVIQVLKVIVVAAMLAVLTAGLWFAGFYGITHMSGGFGLKAGLFLALNLLFVTTLMFGIGWVLLRPPRGPPTWPWRRAARKIADITDVPIVTFGHTHDEVVWKLRRKNGEPTWYYNTGTWVAVFTHDELLPRERVQYTFLRVRDNDAELLHWSPGRGEAIPVILLEEVNRFGEPARPTEAAAK